jgi:hypothetical protein
MTMIAMLKNDARRLRDFHREFGGNDAIGAASDAVGSEMFAAHALKRSPERIIPNKAWVFYTFGGEETTRFPPWRNAESGCESSHIGIIEWRTIKIDFGHDRLRPDPRVRSRGLKSPGRLPGCQ